MLSEEDLGGGGGRKVYLIGVCRSGVPGIFVKWGGGGGGVGGWSWGGGGLQ